MSAKTKIEFLISNGYSGFCVLYVVAGAGAGGGCGKRTVGRGRLAVGRYFSTCYVASYTVLVILLRVVVVAGQASSITSSRHTRVDGTYVRHSKKTKSWGASERRRPAHKKSKDGT